MIRKVLGIVTCSHANTREGLRYLPSLKYGTVVGSQTRIMKWFQAISRRDILYNAHS